LLEDSTRLKHQQREHNMGQRIELDQFNNPFLITDSPGVSITVRNPYQTEESTIEIDEGEYIQLIENFGEDQMQVDKVFDRLNQIRANENQDDSYDIINVQQDTPNEVTNE